MEVDAARVHYFPGGAKEPSAAARAGVLPARNAPSGGAIVRAGGPSAGGWTIVAVHESKASWEQFRDGTLRPAFEKGLGGSFTSSPQESAFEVYNLQK